MSAKLAVTIAVWDRLFKLVSEWRDDPNAWHCMRGYGCLRPKGHQGACFPQVKLEVSP